MIDDITRARAAEAGLPAAESNPDPALHCFPLKIDWQNTLPILTAEPFPAPTYTSFDPGAPLFAPAPVAKLAEFAREHSWEVRTQYSQGHIPHGTTGKPSALKDLIGVRFGAHPMTDRQAYAVYVRNASGGTWSWGSVMVWGPDLPPAKLFDLSSLKAYLIMCADSPGEALVSWTQDMRTIEENRKAHAARQARTRTAQPREVG